MGNKRIKGTKPTLMQRESLKRAKIKDPDNWFFVKSQMVQENGKTLNRTSVKNEIMTFVNRTTGDTIEIPSAISTRR